jgi:hypothetical protein
VRAYQARSNLWVKALGVIHTASGCGKTLINYGIGEIVTWSCQGLAFHQHASRAPNQYTVPVPGDMLRKGMRLRSGAETPKPRIMVNRAAIERLASRNFYIILAPRFLAPQCIGRITAWTIHRGWRPASACG